MEDGVNFIPCETGKINLYKEAGVDVEKSDIVTIKIKSICDEIKEQVDLPYSVNVDKGICHINGSDYAFSADGVGTKILLAKEFGMLHSVGIDLVAMNVNDLLVQFARPILFSDYIAVGKIIESEIEQIILGIKCGCVKSGCVLIGGELAEMPDMYDNKVDLAGFAFGMVTDNVQNIRGGSISDGDLVIGLPSSGFHSNGFSLIREVIRKSSMIRKENLVPEFLVPTEIYVDDVFNLFSISENNFIKELMHITGGGINGRIKKVIGDSRYSLTVDVEKLGDISIFNCIMEYGNIDFGTMINTFNMGIGFIAIVDKKISKFINDTKWEVIGEVSKGNGEVIFV
jgi:phosphoribosylaminoimidazole synthetase